MNAEPLDEELGRPERSVHGVRVEEFNPEQNHTETRMTFDEVMLELRREEKSVCDTPVEDSHWEKQLRELNLRQEQQRQEQRLQDRQQLDSLVEEIQLEDQSCVDSEQLEAEKL